jgi:hypothetical protein
MSDIPRGDERYTRTFNLLCDMNYRCAWQFTEKTYLGRRMVDCWVGPGDPLIVVRLEEKDGHLALIDVYHPVQPENSLQAMLDAMALYGKPLSER